MLATEDLKEILRDISEADASRLRKIEEALALLPREELIELTTDMIEIVEAVDRIGPRTPDQLHAWVKEKIGIHIPRNSVCHHLGHCAPFDFLVEAYFEIVLSILVMANRGGSKTYLCALWHLLNSKFKPKCESASVGAVEMQARRAYIHMQKFLDIPELKEDLLGDPTQMETKWKNGAKVEILPGTMSGVNGPHPQKVHADEIELMDPDVFQESRNMSASKDGIKAQDVITSTRKRGAGPMQKLIDEVEKAKNEGYDPPYKLMVWCIFEVAEQQPNCRRANPDHPDPCTCNKIVKGRWDDGTPRTFDTVCNGRLARSDGWIPLHDIHKVFREDTKDVWEAQQECLKPSLEGVVYPGFTETEMGLQSWTPDPAYGPIIQGVDFGGTHPHCCLYAQFTRVDVEATLWDGRPVVVPAGSFVIFDEIYIADVANQVYIDMMIAKEANWREVFPDFRVAHRFADPSGKGVRMDMRQKGLKTTWYIPRENREQRKRVKSYLDDHMLWGDRKRCPMMFEEARAYHYPPRRPGMTDDPEEPVDDFNHAMDALKYLVANFHAILTYSGGKRRKAATGGRTHETTQTAATPSAVDVGRYATRGAMGHRAWKEGLLP